ncbi:MAG: phage head closure protein [Methylocystis sp.]|nr:phage head closure protein [Methylocystis sp.]
MKSATIGALRHRVTLEAPSDTPDGVGGFTRSYAAVTPLWARIEPVAAQENFLAQRQEQETTHRVTIRWRAGVTRSMRFDHRGRKLLIRSVVDPDERRRFLVCRCEEISA